MRIFCILYLWMPLICHGADNTNHLGRLFMTEDERIALERLRLGTIDVQSAPAESAVVAAQQTSSDQSVAMQGYIRSHDGKQATVWINHVPAQENTTIGDIHIGKLQLQAASAELHVRLYGKTLRLKAGQTDMVALERRGSKSSIRLDSGNASSPVLAGNRR